MKKLLLNSGLVIALSLAISIVFYYLINKHGFDKTVWSLKYCVNSKDYNDVIFIGTSRAHYDIDPGIIDSVTGLKSYNIAENGAGIVECNMFLNAYLEHHVKPKVVFISTDFNRLNLRGYVHNITGYFGYLNDPVVYNSLSPYKLSYKYKLLQPYHWLDETLSTTDDHKFYAILSSVNIVDTSLISEFERNPFPERGHLVINKPWVVKEVKGTVAVKSAYPPTDGIKLLIEMEELCKRDSIIPIFLILPIQYQNTNFYTNQAETLEAIKETALKYNVPLWNYLNDSICYKNNFFYDYIHLNSDGAKVFSARFASDIEDKLLKPGLLNHVKRE